MFERDWRFPIDDVLLAASHIAEDISGPDPLSFFLDRRTRPAVERKLSVIGAAIRNIPADILAAETRIPWSRIVGARNILVHGYMSLDHHLVWRMASERIPELVAVMRDMKERHSR